MPNLLKDQIALRQQDSHTYAIGHDPSWQIGPVAWGGSTTAIMASVAQMHFETTLSSWKQPDVHTLHLGFFRPCTAHPSTVKVTDLKVGKGSSCIQLTLYQIGSEVRCMAIATSTNFDASLGPTASDGAGLSPMIGPIPDFDLIEAKKFEPNWLASRTVSDLLPILAKLTFLLPMEGHCTPGIIDYWCGFNRPEEFDLAHLAMLSDVCPSASDTLLRTGGVWDAHTLHQTSRASANTNPGQPAILTPTIKEASRAPFWNATLTMDMQFKRRIRADDGWTFNRAITKSLDNGRMDLTIDIYDKKLRPLCLVRQLMLIVGTGRRFAPQKKGVAKESTSKL